MAGDSCRQPSQVDFQKTRSNPLVPFTGRPNSATETVLPGAIPLESPSTTFICLQPLRHRRALPNRGVRARPNERIDTLRSAAEPQSVTDRATRLNGASHSGTFVA